MGAVLNRRLVPVIVVLNLSRANCDELESGAGAANHGRWLIISKSDFAHP